MWATVSVQDREVFTESPGKPVSIDITLINKATIIYNAPWVFSPGTLVVSPMMTTILTYSNLKGHPRVTGLSVA